MIKRIAIVGLGLMGASFGRLLVKNGYEVYGLDSSDAVMQKAKLACACTEVLTCQNAAKADMLIVATYPRSFKEIAQKWVPLLKKGAVVSDFCGNKRTVCATMETLAEAYPSCYFVGGHPMAGREYSGVEHSSVRLFDGASMVLVPVSTDIAKLAEVKDFYIKQGFGNVVICTAERHDEMIAYTSQLCHVVSNAFIKSPTAKQHAGYSAGSYKDLTRVARLNPVMWAELMQDNKDKLVAELDTLIVSLSRYSDALKKGDEQQLKKLLDEGSTRKAEIDKR